MWLHLLAPRLTPKCKFSVCWQPPCSNRVHEPTNLARTQDPLPATCCKFHSSWRHKCFQPSISKWKASQVQIGGERSDCCEGQRNWELWGETNIKTEAGRYRGNSLSMTWTEGITSGNKLAVSACWLQVDGGEAGTSLGRKGQHWAHCLWCQELLDWPYISLTFLFAVTLIYSIFLLSVCTQRVNGFFTTMWFFDSNHNVP